MSQRCIDNLIPGDQVEVKLHPNYPPTRLTIGGYWQLSPPFYKRALCPIALLSGIHNWYDAVYLPDQWLVLSGASFPSKYCVPIYSSFHHGLTKIFKK